jgi:putative MATE family efflux protein
MLKKFIGNKQFYKNILTVCLPIVLSQLITQFVSLLDNLMVGQLSPAEYNGVAIANQFLFVFMLAIYGALAGPGIFSTQYHGAKNEKGIRECVRYKWAISFIILIISILIFVLFDDQLINLFISTNDTTNINPEDILNHSKTYLQIMLIGLVPFVLTEIYSSHLREAKHTIVPMISNITAVFVNLVLNYILIFGNLGAPALGIKGAAIATVISRFIACLIVVLYAHLSKKYTFVNAIFKRFFPKKETIVYVFKNSYILLINEIMWSLGMTLLNYCFSKSGNEAYTAVNITSTFSNLFGLVGTSVGTGMAVLLGQQLGSKKFVEAKEDSYRYISFALFIGIVVGTLMFILRNTVPQLYDFDHSIIKMAETLIMISAFMVPIRVYSITCYFIIRSGGKVFITFLFDSVFTIVIRLGITFIFVLTTNVSIYYIYLISELLEVIKIVVGTVLVNKGIWLNNLE